MPSVESWCSDHRRIEGIHPGSTINDKCRGSNTCFCCAVHRWQTKCGVHLLHEHPWGASSWDLGCLEAVKKLPGVVDVRCDEHLYGLVERWPKEGGWGEGPSTQGTGWMTSMNDLTRELIEVQGLNQGHEWKSGGAVLDHARDGAIPSQTGSGHHEMSLDPASET